MESGLELALLFGADTLEQEAAGYLACLEKAGAGGLKLTKAQALELAQTHRQALAQAGRVALGPGAVEKLLEIFEDSPYLEEENCLYILEELTTLFCRYKSDTWDQLSDEMLLACMKTAFDGCCCGSLELLESRALPRLARQVREKGPSAAENFLAEGSGMEGLTRFPPLREEERRPENLFAALFRRGSAGGYLSDADSAGLRRALLRLVQQGADRWCGSPASSLPKEKAEILTASVLYVLGLGLEELPEEAALRCLKQLPLPELYHRGMDRIRRKTAVCRHRTLYLQGDLFQTPNVFYNDTLGPGLRGFFKLYAPEIDALHLPITADYTPCLGRPEDKGIGFMERYLDRLEPENRFLRRFAPERVDALLKSISSEYAQIPLNLFEPVFACALLLTLIGREPRELSLLPEEREVLEGEIVRCREGELERLLRRALAELADMWALPGSMIRYLESCLILLLPWWKGAADRGTLDRVLLCSRSLRSVDSAAAGAGV